MDAEFAVDPAEVELDGLRGHEQGGGRLAVGRAAGDEQGHLRLLRGQVVGGRGLAPPDGLTCRAQLGARPLRPRRGAERVEGGERRAQRRAGARPSPRASQALAVALLRAGALERGRKPLMPIERLLEPSLEVLVGGQEPMAARRRRQRPRPAGVARLLVEGLQRAHRLVMATRMDKRFDEVGSPLHDLRLAQAVDLGEAGHRLESGDR